MVGREAWTGRPGLLVYVMVDDAAATVAAIEANGGEIVQAIRMDRRRSRRGSDPAGNVMGIYQEPVKKR